MTARLLLLASLIASPFISSPALGQTQVFQHARIIDGTGAAPIEDGTLVVKGATITAVGKAGSVKVPRGATVIDATGKTIMPGIVNAHGHAGVTMDGKNRNDAYNRENIQKQMLQYAHYGVTSVLALGLNRDLGYDIRAEGKAGKFPGAQLYSAGRGIGVPDGAPPLPVAIDQVYRPKTVDEAIQEVDETATHKPDAMKIWVDDIFGKMPKLKQDIYQAVIDESHKHHIKVAAHVFYLEDAKALAKSGLDAFGHSVRDALVDDELIQLMKSKGMVYIPTLNVDESGFFLADDPTILDDPFFIPSVGADQLAMLKSPEYKAKVANDPNTAKNRSAHDFAMKNLKLLHDGGVTIALGTDSGGNPTRIQGFGEHRELELMVQAGLTPMEALVAATKTSSTFIGATDRGTLAKGKRADFIMLTANPLDDIRNTRKIDSVFIGGAAVPK